jgi:hypothetical protein
MDNPKVFDQDGNEKDWDWLRASFGALAVERADATAGKVFRVVEVHDWAGPATQLVNVTDAAGRRMEGITVVRWWPDAPKLPAWGDKVSRWRNRGVYGDTNSNGDIGFGMGGGDYYFPPSGGASAVWVASLKGPSDFVSGLGMLGGTDHRHIDVFYKLVDLDSPAEPAGPTEPAEPIEPSTATEGQWQTLLAKLDRIIALLEARSG